MVRIKKRRFRSGNLEILLPEFSVIDKEPCDIDGEEIENQGN